MQYTVLKGSLLVMYIIQLKKVKLSTVYITLCCKAVGKYLLLTEFEVRMLPYMLQTKFSPFDVWPKREAKTVRTTKLTNHIARTNLEI